MVRTTNGFNGYTDSKLLTKANFIYAQMFGNPAFEKPAPTLVVLHDAIKAYSTALDLAATRQIFAVSEKNSRKMELVNIMRSMGNYVTAIADGDVNIINNSGFEHSKPPEPAESLVTPAAPKVLSGANAGTLVVATSGQKGSITNRFLISENLDAPLEQWISVYNTRVKVEFSNLKSATRYYSKVCQIGRGQQCVVSPASSFVTQ